MAEREGSAQAARHARRSLLEAAPGERRRAGLRGARAGLGLCALWAASCGAAEQLRPAGLAPTRVYTIESLRTPVVAADSGSCRSHEPHSGSFLSDYLQSRIGQRILVRIDEPDDAQARAERATPMDDSRRFGLAAAITRAHPGLDVRDALAALSASDTPPAAAQEQTAHCRPSMALRVSRELPDGELFVEGTKVLVATTRELHIYVAGVIRTRDIAEDASVRSSLLADAEVEFVGRGMSSDARAEPWLQPFVGARRAR